MTLANALRPYLVALSCPADGTGRAPSGEPLLSSCDDTQAFKSFYSGHAAATATMAGLTCAHRQHLSLYGGGFADLAPYGFGSGRPIGKMRAGAALVVPTPVAYLGGSY